MLAAGIGAPGPTAARRSTQEAQRTCSPQEPQQLLTLGRQQLGDARLLGRHLLLADAQARLRLRRSRQRLALGAQ